MRIMTRKKYAREVLAAQNQSHAVVQHRAELQRILPRVPLPIDVGDRAGHDRAEDDARADGDPHLPVEGVEERRIARGPYLHLQ